MEKEKSRFAQKTRNFFVAGIRLQFLIQIKRNLTPLLMSLYLIFITF